MSQNYTWMPATKNQNFGNKIKNKQYYDPYDYDHIMHATKPVKNKRKPSIKQRVKIIIDDYENNAHKYIGNVNEFNRFAIHIIASIKKEISGN